MSFEERREELSKWAEREVEIVLAALEKEGATENEKDVYRAALTTYNNLIYNLEEEAMLEPIKAVMMSLMLGEPLTPIDDREEDWILVEGFDPAAGNENPGYSIYQNRRRNTLFKKHIVDGDKECTNFSDVGRAVCVDLSNGENYEGGFGLAIFDRMHPITMPYSPRGTVRIFTEDFKYHEDFEGDYDTYSVVYFRYPDGFMEEVKRFFKMDPKINQLVAIPKEEYFARRKKWKEHSKK